VTLGNLKNYLPKTLSRVKEPLNIVGLS